MIKSLPQTVEFINNLEGVNTEELMLLVNQFHCMMKESSKSRVCNGDITEDKYKQLRLIEALLSFIDEDLQQHLDSKEVA